jgi:hypothetical protein
MGHLSDSAPASPRPEGEPHNLLPHWRVSKKGPSDMSKEWMARERWDALVRGEGCPLCAELAADAAWTSEGYVVADLAVSRLRLSTHQSLPG